jgi:hypothetical protein
MPNRTEAAQRKLRHVPPGGYSHCACSRLHTMSPIRILGGRRLLQLRVLRLGFLQDRDVGVGVFPEGEEILVSGARFG